MRRLAQEQPTYSAVLRDLRKNHKNKVEEFLKSFKDAFDQAVSEDLDDVEQIALMEAMQAIDYQP